MIWPATKRWNLYPYTTLFRSPGKVPSYLNNILLSIWRERSDLQKAYPEVAEGNFNNLMDWAATKGWNEDVRLASLIPPGKVPSYLNDILLSIWNERSDLQKAYPEVAEGNFNNLMDWAATKGWNEDKRLAG